MTIQQVVGLGAAISAAVVGILVGAGSDVPSWVVLVFSALSAAFGAANIYLGNTLQMAKAIVRRHGLPDTRSLLQEVSEAK